MAYYTEVTELPPMRWPGVKAGLVFRWTDSYTDKLYQLYINGTLTAETQAVGALKQLTAKVPKQFYWEIMAIDPEDAGTDYSDYLTETDDTGARVEFSWDRDPSKLEAGSYVDIFWDAGTGEIDYDTPINESHIYNFPTGAVNSGFGLGEFGAIMGYSGAGVGFGAGVFGGDEDGFEFDQVVWTTRPLPAGTYQFDVVLYDAAGNSDGTGNNVQTVVVNCAPPAPKSIVVKSYDSDTDGLVLTVTEGEAVSPY